MQGGFSMFSKSTLEDQVLRHFRYVGADNAWDISQKLGVERQEILSILDRLYRKGLIKLQYPGRECCGDAYFNPPYIYTEEAPRI